MKFIFKTVLLLALLVSLFSCKTDFDVTAEYKEIAIVYGLLNQQDSLHILRINKAFLGDGNALVYAGISDSSSYGTDIDVTLLEKKGSQLLRTITFDTLTIHDKDSGLFYSPDQLMYVSDALLDSSYVYELHVKNRKSGYEASSVTDLIYHPFLTSPKNIDFKRTPSSKLKIEWKAAMNGRRYQPTLTFYFKEIENLSDTIIRHVDFSFQSLTAESLNGTDNLTFYFLSDAFYSACLDKIPYADAEKEQNQSRIVDHFELGLTVIGDEFNTYMDVNGPSTGLLLEKPSYSNITNCIGVFSCKYGWNRSFKVGENIKKDLRDAGLNFVIN